MIKIELAVFITCEFFNFVNVRLTCPFIWIIILEKTREGRDPLINTRLKLIYQVDGNLFSFFNLHLFLK